MPDHESDPNLTTTRIVGQTAANEKPLPAGLEAAWSEWSKSIKGVDERGWTLLRAAFEAGWEAGTKSFAASGGRAGGKARAEKLPPERRTEIAKKAAAKRWSFNESSDES